MQLGEWLQSRNMSHDAFADLIGTDRSSVTKYVAGQRTPRPEVLVRIIDATGGEVTANDFLPSPPDAAGPGDDPGAGSVPDAVARFPERAEAGHLVRAARIARLSA